ncbi:LacI family DNA-binding transcriptional regulator [Pseudopedobacter beijingensis]|uniref:LacI family DNA-binding transcriptional regulator n=1 Tax=Pseudopedobacter beijingensis TaxID=1207056 RepID=A0ABW4I946_9SPHI
MKNITIKTISENTQVSLTTVSRVMNGVAEKYRISAKTAERVLKEAEKLGYIPNQSAINLRLKKSFSIGLIVPSLANPFFSTVVSIVNKTLHEKGYSLLVADSNENEQTEIDAVKHLVSRNIEGIIIIPSGRKTDHINQLIKRNLPVVFVDRYFKELPVSYVSTDHFDGAFKMVEYLISRGHKHIACIQGGRHVMSNQERVNGYKAAISKNGFGYEYVGGNSFTMEDGYLETKLLLQQREKPTAIFALSDTILLGVLKALKEDGYQVPDDISVASFDNSIYLDYLACPVTSISQPISEISQIAIRLLLDKVDYQGKDGSLSDKQEILISPSIIHRKSVKDIL